MPAKHWVAYDRAGICPRGRISQIKYLGHIYYQLAGRFHSPFSHSIWVMPRIMVCLILQWVAWDLPWEVDTMCLGWKYPVGFPLFFGICSVPLLRSLVRLLCVSTRIFMGTSTWMTSHCLEERLVCIVYNSARTVVSPMENFLLWSRIIQMIDALVLIVMALQDTRDKALMESMILTRARNIGIVLEKRVNLMFAYNLSSSMSPSAASGISGFISFFRFLMSWRVTYDARVRASSSSLIDATWSSVKSRTKNGEIPLVVLARDRRVILLYLLTWFCLIAILSIGAESGTSASP